jgi:hypothetical protein
MACWPGLISGCCGCFVGGSLTGVISGFWGTFVGGSSGGTMEGLPGSFGLPGFTGGVISGLPGCLRGGSSAVRAESETSFILSSILFFSWADDPNDFALSMAQQPRPALSAMPRSLPLAFPEPEPCREAMRRPVRLLADCLLHSLNDMLLLLGL